MVDVAVYPKMRDCRAKQEAGNYRDDQVCSKYQATPTRTHSVRYVLIPSECSTSNNPNILH